MFEPGSQFSHIVLGTVNALRRATFAEPGLKEAISRFIGTCDMMLGVSFEPPVVDGDERVELLTALARACDGLLFDGQSLMSPDFTVLAELAAR